MSAGRAEGAPAATPSRPAPGCGLGPDRFRGRDSRRHLGRGTAPLAGPSPARPPLEGRPRGRARGRRRRPGGPPAPGRGPPAPGGAWESRASAPSAAAWAAATSPLSSCSRAARGQHFRIAARGLFVQVHLQLQVARAPRGEALDLLRDLCGLLHLPVGGVGEGDRAELLRLGLPAQGLDLLRHLRGPGHRRGRCRAAGARWPGPAPAPPSRGPDRGRHEGTPPRVALRPAPPRAVRPRPPRGCPRCERRAGGRLLHQLDQVLAQLLEARVALLALSAQRLQDHGLEPRGELGGGQRRGVRVLVTNAEHDARDGVGGERLLRSEQLVEDRPHGEHVAQGVGPPALDHLRRAVVDAGEQRSVVSPVVRLQGRHPEVHDLHHPFGVHAHVGGFQVAVHQTRDVGPLQALANLPQHVHRPFHREGASAAHHPLEVDALHELHGHVGPAPVLARLQHVDQVRVGEVAGELGLAQEARASSGTGGELLRHHLEGDPPPARGVPGLVDGGRAPAPKDTTQLEISDRLHVLSGPDLPGADSSRWGAAASAIVAPPGRGRGIMGMAERSPRASRVGHPSLFGTSALASAQALALCPGRGRPVWSGRLADGASPDGVIRRHDPSAGREFDTPRPGSSWPRPCSRARASPRTSSPVKAGPRPSPRAAPP